MTGITLRLRYTAALLVCYCVIGCMNIGEAGEKIVYSGHHPVWLNEQGWTRDESKEFYFKGQGSELIPYEWFLALEQADSTEDFHSDKNMVALGYITQPASKKNPDALPIGFVLDDNPATRQIKTTSYGSEYDEKNYPKTEKWLGLAVAHSNGELARTTVVGHGECRIGRASAEGLTAWV